MDINSTIVEKSSENTELNNISQNLIQDEIFNEGEIVEGEIIDVEKENVVIKFKEKSFTVEKETLGNIENGEKIKFDVIKSSNNEIILKKKIENVEIDRDSIAKENIKRNSIAEKENIITKTDIANKNVTEENKKVFEQIKNVFVREKIDFSVNKEHSAQEENLSNEAVKEKIDLLEKVMVIVTSDDLEELEEQGQNIGEIEVKKLQTILKKMHTERENFKEITNEEKEKCGIVDKIVDNSMETQENNEKILKNVDNLKKEEKIQKKYNKTIKYADKTTDIRKITEKSKEYGLELNKKEVEKIYNALNMTKGISTKSKIYLIGQQKEPTIENIYKASHLTNRKTNYNNSYMTNTVITREELEELQPQIENIIKSSGRTVDNSTLEEAKWLIKNDLPLTNENLTQYEELSKIEKYTTNELIEKIVQGVANGEDVLKVNLLTKTSSELENATKEIIQKIDSISDKAIQEMIEENKKLTIENLAKKQEEIDMRELATSEKNTENKIIKENKEVEYVSKEQKEVEKSTQNTLEKDIEPKKSEENKPIKENKEVEYVSKEQKEVEERTQNTLEKDIEPKKSEENKPIKENKEVEYVSKEQKEVEKENLKKNTKYENLKEIEKKTKDKRLEATEKERRIENKNVKNIEADSKKETIKNTIDDKTRKEWRYLDRKENQREEKIENTEEIKDTEEIENNNVVYNVRNHKRNIDKKLENTLHKTTVNEEYSKLQENDTYEKHITQENKRILESDVEVIRAKRQLEEIRLKMTLQSGKTLLKNGIDIDTKELESVVDELRSLENSYYEALLDDNVEKSGLNVDNLKETVDKVNDLKSMSAIILSYTFESRKIVTLNKMHEIGTEYEKEINAYKDVSKIDEYENLMTKPRKDMGDSIKKAFVNINDILADLGMEETQLNQRAVRILGYNSIEITKNNIEEMKLYDTKVTELINNLTPNVAVELIKNKINPLEVPIDDLNEVVLSLKDDMQETNEENYSKFLWKLEHKGEITQEERESYIGMYRLVNAIKKSDGAVIGATVNSGKEITLSNLLEAVRTNKVLKGKSGGIDIEIDDEFGGERTTFIEKANAIDRQIKTAYQTNEKEQNTNNVDKQIENTVVGNINNVDKQIEIPTVQEENVIEQTQIFTRNILENLSPEFIDYLKDNNIDMMNITLEKIAELITNYDEFRENDVNKKYYQERVNEIRNIVDKNGSLVKVLDNADMQMTLTNLVSSADMLEGNGITKVVKKMLKKGEQEEKEILESIDNIYENFNSKDDIQSYYQEMTQKLQKFISDEKKNVTDSNSLAELIRLGHNIKFVDELSKRESFDMPLVVGGEVASVHFTITNSIKKDNQSVNIRYLSETLGEINAEFYIKDKKVSGTFIAQDRDIIDELENSNKEFLRNIKSFGLGINSINYGVQNDLTYKFINSIKGNEVLNIEDVDDSSIMENQKNGKSLYSLAKQIILNLTEIHKKHKEIR